MLGVVNKPEMRRGAPVQAAAIRHALPHTAHARDWMKNICKQNQHLRRHLYRGATSDLVANIGPSEVPGSRSLGVAGFPLIVPFMLCLNVKDSVGGVPGHSRARGNDSCQSFIGLVHG